MPNGFRYTQVPGGDNTFDFVGRENIVPVFAASILINATFEKTKVWIGPMTGALTLTAETTKPLKGDELVVMLFSDGSSRTVTLGTGLGGLTASTIVIAGSKSGNISFVFDGSLWKETSRSVMV